MLYLGVNTGTSADAIDSVFCEITGDGIRIIATDEYKLSVEVRQSILRAVKDANLTVQDFQSLKGILTDYFCAAIQQALRKHAIKSEAIVACGLHGQTIHHRPDHPYPYSLQCVDAAKVAHALGLVVIEDFRAADLALGGQGAPIIPGFLRYLLQMKQQKSGLFINLGGIANMTVIDEDSTQGWDIGPANALMDIWIYHQKGEDYDHNGDWARSGNVVPALLSRWLADPYFSQKPPKSTGRDYFTLEWVQKSLQGERAEDVQATLLALTIHSISQTIKSIEGRGLQGCYLYGKGVANRFLVEQLSKALPSSKLLTTMDLGVEPGDVEGGLFAWLAFCYMQKIPTDLTGVTGARSKGILGVCHQAKSWAVA